MPSRILIGMAVVANAVVLCGEAPPAFEVASIRPSLSVGGNNIGISQDTLTMRGVTLNICIKWAYGVQDSQIVGPPQLNSERYDIVAKAVAPADAEQMKLMLQTLLAERFRLALHKQVNAQNVYAMVLAKSGPKFHASEGEGLSSLRGKGQLVAQWATMEQLANFLSGPMQSRVIDATGLGGRYDFTLDLVANLQADHEPDLIGAVIASLPEQLGLKLESRKMPVEVLIVDHVEKPPEN